MTTASNRDQQIMLPAEVNGGNHVGHVRTLGDQTGFAANHSVIDLALFFVARICGLDQITPKLAFEFIDGFLLHDSSISPPASLSRGCTARQFKVELRKQC